MVQYVVLTGLLFNPKTKKSMDEVNDFFKEKGWGKLKYKMQFKTLPGFGGPGGRNDVVFEWSGTDEELGKFAVQRFSMGADAPRWLEDYIANSKPIIPTDVREKLEKIRGG